MTRDFSKRRRDDARPPSRNYSAGRFGDRPPPRAAHSRPNRETVDHGWETGAQHHHPDYRPRGANHGQPARDNQRRSNQQFDHPTTQNSRNSNGRRPYASRQDNYQYNRHSTHRNTGSRSYDPGTRNFDEQRSANRGGQRDFRAQDRDRDQERNYSRGGFEREQGNRFRRNDDRDSRAGNNGRYGQRRGKQNPRWQSRPAAQRGYTPPKPQAYGRYGEGEEQFEGDYERFDAPEAPGRSERRPHEQRGRAPRQREYTPRQEERHVTHLPSGRVLKGPRPVQRRNAEFWTDVEQEADALVPEEKPAAPKGNRQAPDSSKAALRGAPQQRPTAKAKERGSKERKTRGRERTEKAPGRAPRPSERGFRWSK